jgi:hypothetical protein
VTLPVPSVGVADYVPVIYVLVRVAKRHIFGYRLF